MPKQPAFPSLRNVMKKKQTRRELFLTQMEVVVPWDRRLGLSEAIFADVNAHLADKGSSLRSG